MLQHAQITSNTFSFPVGWAQTQQGDNQKYLWLLALGIGEGIAASRSKLHQLGWWPSLETSGQRWDTDFELPEKCQFFVHC